MHSKRLVLPIKKTIYAQERDSERVKNLRESYLQKQGTMDANRLIFLDESGMRLGATTRYGWSPRGTKAFGKDIHGSWQTITMLGAIGLDGFRGFANIDAATSGDVFRAFVKYQLVPHLQPGDIVVMDNLAAHKDKQALASIQNAGASVLFLPPYSPEWNPIEKLWSKLKDFVRRCRTDTRELFDNAVAGAMDNISTTDIQGWFTHCGYTLS